MTDHNRPSFIHLKTYCISFLNMYTYRILTVSQQQALGHGQCLGPVLSEQLKATNEDACSSITKMLDYMYQRQNCNEPNPPHNERINPPLHSHVLSLRVSSDKPAETDRTEPPAYSEFIQRMFCIDHN